MKAEIDYAHLIRLTLSGNKEAYMNRFVNMIARSHFALG